VKKKKNSLCGFSFTSLGARVEVAELPIDCERVGDVVARTRRERLLDHFLDVRVPPLPCIIIWSKRSQSIRGGSGRNKLGELFLFFSVVVHKVRMPIQQSTRGEIGS
jgi:hypothetical protein